MNVTKNLISRIEEYRAVNKNPCKSYSTEQKAEAVAEMYARKFADYYSLPNDIMSPCRYMVVFNEAWGRWVVAFDFVELMQRKQFTGGYIGVASDQGFFTY